MNAGLAATNRRVQMMVSRATIAKVDDDPMIQELQVELLSDETQESVEHFQPYGFAAHPKAGAEAIMLAVGGLRSHGLVINVADRRYRLTGLQEGEVAIHDDQGQKVLLGRDGITIHGKTLTFESEGDIAFTADGDVTFETEGNVSFDCDGFTATASGTANLASDDVLLGNGASLQAARKTDSVASSAISTGSAKVKIA
ncbi:MAG: phage baseplate assembly protein V [Sphingomonas sp.]